MRSYYVEFSSCVLFVVVRGSFRFFKTTPAIRRLDDDVALAQSDNNNDEHIDMFDWSPLNNVSNEVDNGDFDFAIDDAGNDLRLSTNDANVPIGDIVSTRDLNQHPSSTSNDTKAHLTTMMRRFDGTAAAPTLTGLVTADQINFYDGTI